MSSESGREESPGTITRAALGLAVMMLVIALLILLRRSRCC